LYIFSVPLFDPASAEPFRLSRSKIETFIRCPRCFVLDRKFGAAQPNTPPYTLNLAVDHLLKREFDAYRQRGAAHPLMVTYGIDAIPLRHALLDTWRDARQGIAHAHAATGFEVFGAVDDVWQASDGALIVVDYKATSTPAEVTLDGMWKDGYKRQVEIYQWLFRRNAFPVSDTAYFVYANADKDRAAFDRRLDFSLQILPYGGDDSWVEDALVEARHALTSSSLPPPAADCEWCGYRKAAGEAEKN
jgi:RecB family exonuclease